MSIWYCFGNFVEYGVDFDVCTAAGRILTVGLHILTANRNGIGVRVGTASEDYYLSEISGGSRNYYALKCRQQLYDIGDGFDTGVFGIVTPKQWLYAQDLDVNILSNCPDSTTKSTAIGIEAVGGLCITFAVIRFLLLLLFIWAKRYNIKNYLSKLICRQESSIKGKYSMKTNSNETCKNAQNHQMALADFQIFK
ncbi:unnamed protein product [Rotaria sp. Silwood2]|nr:unnamed protein product [Rotaria sp. Silwood2]CAF4468050.1 unnamed protein product [Rotaria sp. Silwood2]